MSPLTSRVSLAGFLDLKFLAQLPGQGARERRGKIMGRCEASRATSELDGWRFCAPARVPAFLSFTLCAEMPLLQSREKSSVTLSQKSQSVLCKAFLRIDTSRPFPVHKYSPNICTCKCNVSRLYRNANLSPSRNEKNEEAHTFALSTEFISEHLRLFSLVLFLPHPEGNLLPFADDGLLSFSQSPIALAPVFPSYPPCDLGIDWRMPFWRMSQLQKCISMRRERRTPAEELRADVQVYPAFWHFGGT